MKQKQTKQIEGQSSIKKFFQPQKKKFENDESIDVKLKIEKQDENKQMDLNTENNVIYNNLDVCQQINKNDKNCIDNKASISKSVNQQNLIKKEQCQVIISSINNHDQQNQVGFQDQLNDSKQNQITQEYKSESLRSNQDGNNQTQSNQNRKKESYFISKTETYKTEIQNNLNHQRQFNEQMMKNEELLDENKKQIQLSVDINQQQVGKQQDQIQNIKKNKNCSKKVEFSQNIEKQIDINQEEKNQVDKKTKLDKKKSQDMLKLFIQYLENNIQDMNKNQKQSIVVLKKIQPTASYEQMLSELDLTEKHTSFIFQYEQEMELKNYFSDFIECLGQFKKQKGDIRQKLNQTLKLNSSSFTKFQLKLQQDIDFYHQIFLDMQNFKNKSKKNYQNKIEEEQKKMDIEMKGRDDYRIISYLNQWDQNIELKPTEEQLDVIVSDIKKDTKIIACAGSGKTTTLICRIKYLLDHGIKPNQIIITTFNVESGKNISQKISEMIGKEKLAQILIGNIDKIARKFIRNELQAKKKKSKQALYFSQKEYCDIWLENMKKNKYKYLQYKYLFFDEFQDISELQYKILMEFKKLDCILTVIGTLDFFEKNLGEGWAMLFNKDLLIQYQNTEVFWKYIILELLKNSTYYQIKKYKSKSQILQKQGDDAQNIYAFRDTKIDIIQNRIDSDLKNLKKDLQKFTLTTNYRSTYQITEFANKIIENSDNLIQKTMKSAQERINVDELNNHMEKEQQEEGFPHLHIFNSEKQQNEEIICDILLLVKKGAQFKDFAIIGPMKNLLQKFEAQLEKHNYNSIYDKIPYQSFISKPDQYKYINIDASPQKQSQLTITTIHRSKGLEWNYVYFIGCNDDKFPMSFVQKNQNQAYTILEEQRRLFYVGSTRAIKKLNFYCISQDIENITEKEKNEGKYKLTRFFSEIPRKLFICDALQDQYKYMTEYKQTEFAQRNDEDGLNIKKVISEMTSKQLEDINKYCQIKEKKSNYTLFTKTQEISQSVIKNKYFNEMGMFFDRCIIRMIGEKYDAKNSFYDQVAAKVILPILYELKLPENLFLLFLIYCKFFINFDLTQFEDQNKLIQRFQNYDNIKKSEKEINEMKQLHEILLSNLKKPEFQQYTLFNFKHQPNQYFQDEYIKFGKSYIFALSQYMDKSKKSEEIYESIYKVSKCGFLQDYRRKYLYNDNSKDISDKNLLSSINVNFIDKFLQQFKQIECKRIYSTQIIVGLIDIIVNEDHLIFLRFDQFEYSKEDYLNYLFAAAHLYVDSKINVGLISVFNSFTGKIQQIDLKGWTQQQQFYDQIESIAQDQILQNKEKNNLNNEVEEQDINLNSEEYQDYDQNVTSKQDELQFNQSKQNDCNGIKLQNLRDDIYENQNHQIIKNENNFEQIKYQESSQYINYKKQNYQISPSQKQEFNLKYVQQNSLIPFNNFNHNLVQKEDTSNLDQINQEDFDFSSHQQDDTISAEKDFKSNDEYSFETQHKVRILDNQQLKKIKQ